MAETTITGDGDGPLYTLVPVFIDVETRLTEDITLARMTLRQYLKATYLRSIAVAIGDIDPSVFLTPKGKFKPEDEGLCEFLTDLSLSGQHVFVAHNAAFDIRVLVHLLGIPFPKNVWCTMEGTMSAWPELPGGYGLGSIAKCLKFEHTLQKTKINLRTASDQKLRRYNAQDVRVTQELYFRQIARLNAVEQQVGLRTQQQRKFFFRIDQANLQELSKKLNAAVATAELAAKEFITSPDDQRTIFNRDSGEIRSVRRKALLDFVNNHMNGDFTSTSLKKIPPAELARNPRAAALLTLTTQINKMLTFKRLSKVFKDIPEVDVELGYMRAHTGRFSSPAVGKGLNLHGLPKHLKAVAQPVRQVFRLPDDLCFVRADMANIEYRVLGMLTGSKTVLDMFDPRRGGDVSKDPYCESWYVMTRQTITKKSPERQIAKAAVLGLGFCMQPTGFCKPLQTAMSNPKAGITESVLDSIAKDLGWRSPEEKILTGIMKRAQCSATLATAAFNIHRVFNETHVDFALTAGWLVANAQAVATSHSIDDARKNVDRLRDSTRAPDPRMIELSIDDDRTFTFPSLRVRCGPGWVPTVCWREPQMRRNPFDLDKIEPRLTILKANGEIKPFYNSLAIENVTQAAARNGLCIGVELLERLGFPDCLHVHDEILLIVPRRRENVLAARDALIQVFGPDGCHPYGWACTIRPDEIAVTQSMYECEDDIKPKELGGGDRWGRILRNDPECFDNLP